MTSLKKILTETVPIIFRYRFCDKVSTYYVVVRGGRAPLHPLAGERTHETRALARCAAGRAGAGAG